jgi:hypothetical protein
MTFWRKKKLLQNFFGDYSLLKREALVLRLFWDVEKRIKLTTECCMKCFFFPLTSIKTSETFEIMLRSTNDYHMPTFYIEVHGRDLKGLELKLHNILYMEYMLLKIIMWFFLQSNAKCIVFSINIKIGIMQ